MSAYLQHDRKSYKLFEMGSVVGAFYQKMPVHRRLISINKLYTGHNHSEFNLRHDWNSLLSPYMEHPIPPGKGPVPMFRDFSQEFWAHADDLVRYLQSYVEYHDIQVTLNTKIEKVTRVFLDENYETGFKLWDSHGVNHTCHRLLVATGFHRERTINMPGFELATPYSQINLDPASFRNKRILILGLGNSAFETAKYYSERGAAYVHMVGRSHGGLRQAYATHYVGDLRAINNDVVDTFFLKSLDAIDVGCDLRNASLTQTDDGIIFNSNVHSRVKNAHYRHPFDLVVSCLGFRFDNTIFARNVKPEYDHKGKFPQQKSNYESSNVENLFIIGNMMHFHDFRMAGGGFIHGFRYLVRSAYRAMSLAHYKTPMATKTVPATPAGIARAFYERLKTTSALYHMFSVLCDVLVWEGGADDTTAVYAEELLYRDVYLQLTHPKAVWFTLHFDYGHAGEGGYADNSISVLHPGLAFRSQFLHPIISLWKKKGTTLHVVHEYHMMEDFLASWDNEDFFLRPLEEYLTRILVHGDFRTQEQMYNDHWSIVERNLTPKQRVEGAVFEDPYYGKYVVPPMSQEEIQSVLRGKEMREKEEKRHAETARLHSEL